MLVARQQEHIVAHAAQTDDVLATHHARPKAPDANATDNGGREEHGLVHEGHRNFDPGLVIARPHRQVAIKALGFARNFSEGRSCTGSALRRGRRSRG